MFRLDERIRDRIVAETRGNPLALLELPRGLSVEQLAGGFGLLDAPRQALPTRLEESFQDRVQAIPAAARRLLLVAAAEPVGDPLLVWRAAERLGIEVAAADATDGLLTIEESVRFRHPLVRSAVYRSAPVEQRRSAHLALAEATDREVDPDRRAWHLAAAAPAPDEAVAGELERSAGRAQARGGIAAAAAFLQRAVGMTAEPGRRTERALAAAELSFQAGELDTAQRLLSVAESYPLDGFQAARATLLRGHVAFAAGLFGDAPRLLLNAATRIEPFDLDLARETYLNAWAAAVGAGHLAEGDVLLEICRAVRALTPRAGTPLPLDLLLDGLALLITEGRAAAAPTLLRAGRAFAHGDLSVEDTLRWGWLAAAASTAVWDDAGRLAIAARTVQVVRDAGALAQLPAILTVLGTVTLLSGDFAGAAATIAEADSVAAVTGSRVASHIAIRLLALQGREAEASALIAATIEQAGERSITATNAHWAAALLYNGLGRYEEAAGSAQQATSNTFEPWISIWALPELVEAAARGGDVELAREALQRLAETTQPSGTDWALGVEARSRALLSDSATAEELHLEAIDRLSRTQLRPELARAQLLYGEWLRREGRRSDAREQLRTAHHMFAAIGMEGFAERTRRELVATGETVRKRSAETRDELTPQEEQIVRLARDGLSNPEIGAQLFLSSRTVEWHLRKVYMKLGISSRRELWAASVRAAGSSSA
jgi:ATP/maltotriose-dependent transcriptional regulator MalT